jgi:hypothetical protein
MELFIVTAKARGVSLAPNIGQMVYVFVPVPVFAPVIHHWHGGADRDRTGDLLLAKQALSQLSYSPHFQLVIL